MRWKSLSSRSTHRSQVLEYDGSEFCAVIYLTRRPYTWLIYGPRNGLDPNLMHRSGEYDCEATAKREAREKLKELMADEDA